MQVILDVVHGPRKGASFVFDRHDTFIVGRSPYVHCAMPEDSALSRDHFLIEVNPPRCEVRDLGSTNGTFVNDARVERARLNPGDRISAGQSVFVVRYEGQETVADSSGSKTATIGVGPGRRSPAAPAAASWRRRGSRRHDETASWLCELCRGEAATTPQPVPNYKVLRELGRGAMGVVYQASTPRPAGWSR